MRILVDIPFHFNVPEPLLEEWSILLQKTHEEIIRAQHTTTTTTTTNTKVMDDTRATADRDEELQEDKTFIYQFLQEVDNKLAYIKSRPQLIEDAKASQQEETEAIRKEYRKIQEQTKSKYQ